MVHAEHVIAIYQRLFAHGVPIWLIGGWGIDALLGEQTRPHKDLDVIVLLDDVVAMRALLSHDGYALQYLWSENRWTVDAHGIEAPTAFVLGDATGRELDVHAMRLDDRGNGIPAWAAEGFLFAREDLSGVGVVAGAAVPCISPHMQMVCHTGYALPEEHVRDLERLHERFGVTYPAEHADPGPLGA
ncbi:MAG: hypothetical protein JXM73_24165 [Anaerolineae bacterium]|nr:hypothetical protein [Anaerolineae bacterium]